jgi:hypothetical protein
LQKIELNLSKQHLEALKDQNWFKLTTNPCEEKVELLRDDLTISQNKSLIEKLLQESEHNFSKEKKSRSSKKNERVLKWKVKKVLKWLGDFKKTEQYRGIHF